MPPSNSKKPRRQKKRKSRTEVSSDSESENVDTPSTLMKGNAEVNKKTSQPGRDHELGVTTSPTTSSVTDEQVKAAFTQKYLQRATVEFSEDLDKIRGADDFKGVASVEVLIRALKQGVEDWDVEGMKRVIGDGQS